MHDTREALERIDGFEFPDLAFDTMIRRHDRRKRNRRLTSAAMALAVSLATIGALVRAFSASSTVAASPSPPATVHTATPPPSTTTDPATLSPSRRPSSTDESAGWFLHGAFVDIRTGDATRLPAAIVAQHGSREFRVSPDGSRIAFVADDPDGMARVYVSNVDGSGLRPVTTGVGWAESPRWSADGSRIVYLGGTSDIYVLDVESGRSSRITNEHSEIWEPSFTAEGARVLFTMGGDKTLSLWTIPSRGGTPRLFLRDAAMGSISPDGRTIAFRRTAYQAEDQCGRCWWIEFAMSFARGDGSQQLGPARGGQLAQMSVAPTGAAWSPDGQRVVYREGGGGREDRGRIMMIDLGSGTHAPHVIGEGVRASWIDDDTLLVEGYRAPSRER